MRCKNKKCKSDDLVLRWKAIVDSDARKVLSSKHGLNLTKEIVRQKYSIINQIAFPAFVVCKSCGMAWAYKSGEDWEKE